jgi:hypothetical protein
MGRRHNKSAESIMHRTQDNSSVHTGLTTYFRITQVRFSLLVTFLSKLQSEKVLSLNFSKKASINNAHKDKKIA